MSDPDDVFEALASLPSFHHPTATEDGDRVARYYDDTGRNELHSETGERHQASDGEVPRNARWGVEWSADGDRVFFRLDEDGNEQNDVHAIDVDGPTAGETEPVIEMDGQVSLADVGDDGDTLLLGSTRDGQMNLYRHDLAADETEKITDYERAAFGGLLSPDCERIAYATNEPDDFDNMDAYVADSDGSNPRNLEIGETGADRPRRLGGPMASACSSPTTPRTSGAVACTISGTRHVAPRAAERGVKRPVRRATT